MSKPRGIKWLEEQTGEELLQHRAPLSEGKHLSLRVPSELANALEAYAAEHGESVSQVARRLISDGLARLEHPDREAIDNAIALLESVRDADDRRAS